MDGSIDLDSCKKYNPLLSPDPPPLEQEDVPAKFNDMHVLADLSPIPTQSQGFYCIHELVYGEGPVPALNNVFAS
jgi:hypothetical protein